MRIDAWAIMRRGAHQIKISWKQMFYVESGTPAHKGRDATIQGGKNLLHSMESQRASLETTLTQRRFISNQSREKGVSV